MDWLTFISNMGGSFVWPVVFVIGLILFRKQIKTLLGSIKALRIKDFFEAELAEPQETIDQEINTITQEINTITSLLQSSPHSFQWFRDNTRINYSDKQFVTMVATLPKILERINIVSRDEKKRKRTPGLPGMRLTREYRKNLEEMLQKSV